MNDNYRVELTEDECKQALSDLWNSIDFDSMDEETYDSVGKIASCAHRKLKKFIEEHFNSKPKK